MTDCPKVTIGEIARVKGGKRLPPGAELIEEATAHPYLRIVDFRADGLDDANVKFISPEVHASISRYTIGSGDVYVSIAGTIGRVGMVPARLDGANLTENAAKICEIADRALPQFIMYFLRSKDGQDQLTARAGGAAQPKLALYRIETVEVPLPPLPTQQRIAAILSAYDDLIENNTRRIAILEEMARRLYEEWFVRFRFPGHEAVEFVKTSLGMTPSGWPELHLEELVEINPRTRVPKDGQKPFIPMGSLSETSMVIEPVEQREGNSGTKFQNDDTLVARITPCLENGKTGFVAFLSDQEPVAFGSTEFIVLRPSILGRCAVYCLARSHAFRDVAIKSMSGAEGRQRVRPESIQSFPIARPPADLLSRFEGFCDPVFAQVSALARKNANLRAQRDLLLPKLVSGEIDVSGAEAALEAAAE